MKNKCGLTLLELLIVVIIIGVLAALFYPGFRQHRESALNEEARAALKLIQGAEKIYRMEQGFYYGPCATEGVECINNINRYLKLSLPNATTRNWNYIISSVSGAPNYNFVANATRYNAPAGYSRTWTIDSASEPSCSGSFCK